MSYVHRVLEKKLKDYITSFSVVGLTGPRQSGKSTLLRHCLPDYRYVTFDDFKMIDFFSDDPDGFMSLYDNKVIFDEIQKAPRLFDYVKIAVDNDRSKAGKFVLTGSSQFQFIKGVTESLAGRIGLLTLLPFQMSELPDRAKINETIYKGSYPELVQKNFVLSQDWFSSYLETYLTKDVSALAQVGDKREFQKLIQLLAANTSQILNASHYARDLGVDVKTIKRWISILEASYIIFLLPPFHNNIGKRIVKSPKVYFYDTGLVSYLTGVETFNQYQNGPLAGPLFENYVIANIRKNEQHTKSHAELYYLRTAEGIEVDLVIDRRSHCDWVEIKSSSTFNHRWLKPIQQFKGNKDKGYLLYQGTALDLKEIQVLNFCDFES